MYPGLPRAAGHALAAAQMPNGFGGMLSLRVGVERVEGGGLSQELAPDAGPGAALALAGAVRVFTRATSLGGVESLIEHRSRPAPGAPRGRAAASACAAAA